MRRAQVDLGSQPVRNLLTNPAMATAAAGTDVVMTNWASNPGFEGGTTNVQGIGANSAQWTSIGITTDRPRSGTRSYKHNTCTVAGVVGMKNLTASATALLARKGSTVSWSFWVYSTVAGSISPFWEGTKVSDGTYTGGSPAGGGVTSVPANTWTYITATHVLTIDAYVQGGGGHALSVGVGDSVWWDDFCLTQTAVAQPFFSGDTTAANGYTYAWAGTANASASVKKGLTTGAVYRTNMCPYPSMETAGSNVVVGTNLATNPSMETASGTVNVRTNLATNPSMETASGTVNVRTNLFANPSSETTVYPTAGNGTGTASLSTTQKLFGTQSTKFVWVSGATWGGQTPTVSVASNTTYTMSFYVYSESGAIPTSWTICDAVYTSASTMTGTVTAGQWSRVSTTITTGPSQTTLQAYGLIGSAGTFYLDGLLLEQSPALGSYFDGTRVLSNLITNPSFETDTYGWAINTGSTISSSTDQAYRGTKSLKVVMGSTAGGSGQAVVAPTLAANTVYTVSAYVYVPAGSPAIRLFVSGVTNGSSPTTSVTGAWQRISLTFTTAAAQAYSIYFVVGSASTAGQVFYADAVMLETFPDLSPYYEGTGDFTYVWGGTANASVSYQRAPAIPDVANIWGNTSHFQINAPLYAGAKSCRSLWLAPSTLVVTYAVAPVPAGTTVTVSMYVKPSTTLTQVRMLSRSYTDSAGTTGYTDHAGSWTTCPAGVITRLSHTFTTETGTLSIRPMLNVEQTVQPDDFIDVDGVLIEQASTIGVYFDGSNPIQNLVSNPDFETNTTGWYPDQGTPTLTSSTDRAYVGTRSLKCVTTIAGIDDSAYMLATLAANTTYTLSWYVYSPDGLTNSYFDVGGVVSLSQQGARTVPANTWTRVSATFTTPAVTGSATFYLHHQRSTNAAGQIVYIDAVLLERATTPNLYYSGTGDFTYAWSGTANSSNSYQQSPGIAVLGANNPGSVAWQSTTLAYVGTKSLACRATGTNGYNGVSATFVGGLTANTPYTFSAWIYMPTLYGAGLKAIAGGGGMGLVEGTIVATVGAWARVSITFTPASTASVTVYVVTASADVPTAGQIFYTDGWLLERAGFLNPYYDGSTAAAAGITYGWTGTAHLSTSTKSSPGVAGWTAQWYGSTGGEGVFAQSAGTGMLGGTSARKTWTAPNTADALDTGIGITIPATAGVIYTASIHQNSSVTTSLTSYVTWKDAANATISKTATNVGVVSTAGAWTRGSVTATAPANAVTGVFVFGPYLGGMTAAPMPAGSTIDFDGALIEESSVLGPYFDGSVGQITDLQTRWTGTADASTSQLYGAASASYVSEPYTGVWLTDAGGVRVVNFRGTSSSIQTPAGFLVGRKYTVLLRARSYNGGNTKIYGTDTQPNVTLTPSYAWYRYTFTLTADRLYLACVSGANTGFDLTHMMLVEGEYSGDYIDGTKPFSKWDGTANASTSVGYPPQLYDLAGKPAVDLVDAAQNSTATVPDGPITVYAVQSMSAVGTNPGYWEISNGGVWGTSAGTARLIGSTATQGRLDLLNAPTGAVLMTVNLVPTSLGVTVVALDQTVTGADFQSNGGSTATITPDATFRVDVSATIRVGVRDNITQGTTVTTKRLLVYTGKHDATTRLAISRYLGNKYGVIVA